MKVMVGSVYSEHHRSMDWYSLQLDWLESNTDFTHVVFPNCDYDFPRSTVLPRGHDHGQHGHIEGLNCLIDYFRQSDHEYFLLLDSDSFPIKPWMDNLLMAMGDHTVAAPVRYENLDVFAHPCVFFFKREALHDLSFGLNEHINLCGERFRETSANVSRFFPLIRSNAVNLHPIIAGVYWDSFYHHAAGSRLPTFRSVERGYYLSDVQEDKIFSDLKQNSRAFIQNLTKGLSHVYDRKSSNVTSITLL